MTEYCVCCGREIPEGRQVCPICERKADRKNRHEMEAELIIAEENAKSQKEKDIIHLKQIELSIEPGSRWWRYGYVGSLRRAIKLMDGNQEAKIN